MSDKHNAKAFN